MGSLRNPVGPLPSSIYWRRRSVAAALIVLVAVLVAWIVTAGGGGAKKHDDRGGGPAPATSITPGPSGSGPAISQEPGGRDSSGGGGSDGASGGSGSSSAGSGSAGSSGSSGSAGSSGSGDDAGKNGDGGGAAGSGGTGGSAGGAAAGGAAARQVPVGSALPTCSRSALKVALDSTEAAYEPDEKPQFKLVVTNGSGTDCKADLGPKAVVLTITDTDDDQIWTSKDCPKTAHAYFEIPAHATVTRTLTWDRRHSTTKCSAAAPPAAGAGTYLAQITSGVATVPRAQSQKSVRLEQD
ncbi:hypothetical protein AB0910_28430 [Streptomyces sp. NPDC047002]|uniref:hypothetical protein n=1 Tax=Streptomyces sp. NPDC047002 TaxID=3155475 RepID=UPI00345477CF